MVTLPASAYRVSSRVELETAKVLVLYFFALHECLSSSLAQHVLALASPLAPLA